MNHSHTFKIFVLVVFTLTTAVSVRAQENEGADESPEDVGDEALEALGDDRGQSEEEQLEDILGSEENEYDLIKQNNYKINYSFNYSANSSIEPRQRVQVDTGITVFNLLEDSQHTASHRINLSYGLFNWLSTGINIPITTKYNTTQKHGISDIGDISLSARMDPFVNRPGQLSTTFSGNISLPTGRSPWEIDPQEELTTGSGGFSIGGGVNVSKNVDPVAAFGNFNVNIGLPITGLDQVRGEGEEDLPEGVDPGINRLREVRPGPSFSIGTGMAYSLSYDVSLTMSMNYGLSLPTELVFETRTVETQTQISGTFSISTGWRLSPQTITNVGFGIGLTDSSPDMSINVSFPLVMTTPVFD